MEHPRPFDELLLRVLLPIWAVCFGLCLQSVWHPAVLGSCGLGVEAGRHDEYPILSEIAAFVNTDEVDLQRGDRLVQIGQADLRGVGTLGFYARLAAEAKYGHLLNVSTSAMVTAARRPYQSPFASGPRFSRPWASPSLLCSFPCVRLHRRLRGRWLERFCSSRLQPLFRSRGVSP